MMPKHIFTIHFGEQSDLIKRCIESQKLKGYRHTLIAVDNMYKDSRFVNDALNAEEKLGVKRYCKVSDLLRLYHLLLEGGIYLDSDMEVLPGKNFDGLLDNQMFVSQDEAGNYASSAIGSVANHPLLAYITKQVEDNFRGDGNLIWEPGMKYFSDTVAGLRHRLEAEQSVKFLTSDYFFPFHWRSKEINITPNTLCFHHYCGSWNYI